MTVWALYLSTPRYGSNEISLYRTERDALRACREALALDDDDLVSDGDFAALEDDEARYAVLRESGDDHGTEWHIDECQVPE